MSARLTCLKPGDGDEVALGIDFRERPSVSSFPELAANLRGDLRIMGCDASFFGRLSNEQACLEEYVRLVIEELVREGRQVIAVLGRCTGAGLACEIAMSLARAGHPPPAVMVFDAEVADLEAATYKYGEAMRGLTAAFGERIVTEAVESCYDEIRDSDLEFSDKVELMRTSYRHFVLRAMRATGTSAEFGEFMANRFAAFTRYLRCANQARIELSYAPVRRIHGRGHVARQSEQGRPSTSVAVSSDELMSSPDTAHIVEEFLRAAARRPGV